MADAVQEAKRADARVRQEVARTELADFRFRTAPGAYMCWWELPEPWRADTFVAAAVCRGIAVTPGAAFAVPPTAAHNAIRLGLASPTPDALSAALEALATMARSIPEHEPVD